MTRRRGDLGNKLNFSKAHRWYNHRGVMPWKTLLLCLAVVVSQTSCDGHADAQRPSVQGSHHLSDVVFAFRLEPAARTRRGSLTFKFDQQADLNSTNVFQNILAAKLKRLDPSVVCSNDQMTLTVKRTGAPHFLVDSGEVPLTPLSQMPSTCGFSMKRFRRNVQYTANYQGCNVHKQDDDHVLPLRLWGTPMTMSCPATLPSPSIFCFSSKMVVKLGGVAAKDLKVKVSGMWHPLPMTCSSCGLTFEEFSGEVALSVPYNKGPCVEVKDEEHVLSLQWGDFELVAACPPVENADPITGTSPPPSDNNPVVQHPRYSYFPMFPQYGESQPSQNPAPTTPLPLPQLPFVAAEAENQEGPVVQHSAFPFMPQFPQFFLLPSSDFQTQLPSTQNAAAQQPQLPQVSQSPQYQVPVFPQFPMFPGMFPNNPAPTTTPTKALVTTPAPPTMDEKPQVQMQPQFPVPQYPFLQFHKYPSQDQSQAAADPKPVIQQSTPQHLHPQTFQIPLYPPLNYPSPGQSAVQTPAPTPAIAADSPEKLPAGQQFYQSHQFMPLYLVPKQAHMPMFLEPPAIHTSNHAQSDQLEHQRIYQAMSPLYSFVPDQRQMAHERS